MTARSMSSAAVVIMASEPPVGGQQKKMHPLFASPNSSRSNDTMEHTMQIDVGETQSSMQDVPVPVVLPPAGSQDAAQTPDSGSLPASLPLNPFPLWPPNGHALERPPHPEIPLWPLNGQLPAQPPPPVVPMWPLNGFISANTPAAETAPAQAPAKDPAPVNAFSIMQQNKKKAEDVPASGLSESTPPAAEPKKRGRPPKKRKSSPPPAAASGPDNGETPRSGMTASATHHDFATSSTAVTTPGAEPADALPAEPPRRVLRFDPKTGTIGSPPKPTEASPKATGSRRKPAVGKVASKPLVVPYPSQDAASRARIGNLIASVLDSTHRRFPQPPDTTSTSARKGRTKFAPAPAATMGKMYQAIAATPTTDAKITHPFFTGARTKGAVKDVGSTLASSKSSAGSSAKNYYTSTPCSPRRRTPQPSFGLKMPQFGAKNGLLRFPGACLPAWPWKGAVHVHPDNDAKPSSAEGSVLSTLSTQPPPLSLKKRKGYAVDIRRDERILEKMLESLNIASVVQEIRDANGDDFAPAPPELRLPTKHIESGPKLQARIATQLRTQAPALHALFTSLATSLSAFDQHQCETASWAQKYGPSCAAEVLQPGQEPQMLKRWLEALKVVSVDTGGADSGDPKAPSAAKGKQKKKRKKNKLDGFIVSSDDETDGVGETSDNEADWSASGRYGLVKDTVVRPGGLLDQTGRAGARLTNAVVISGPHGCGKSAAVYAVAKELGFEVFEINASSRRSGKDVMDRIGDMTRNHLVQHKHKKQPKAAASAEPSDPIDEDDGMDLEDAEGDPDPDFPMPHVVTTVPTKKQRTMGSFFKSTGKTNGTAVKPTDEASATAIDAEPRTAQSQKQSLILLEEADILYEDDKQFWATVMGLMAQSKRPFVITCNDETLLPLQSLQLHAIFRFTPPPTDVAVDRLLLIAACEGHALQRQAVQCLYEARNCDFRAALVDLQFWCQISVGDRRGGFDWFLQRWPEGVDLDENNHVLRVVSADTFWTGMGWLNNDAAANMHNGCAASCRAEVEGGLVQQAWTDWQLDMGQWQESLDLASWAGQLPDKGASHRRQLLEAYSTFTESMSDADVVSSRMFTTGNKVPFDATQPELPDKAHQDYILGLTLLESVTAAHELDDLRLPLATALRCAAKENLRAETKTDSEATACSSQLDHLDAARVVSSIHQEHTAPQGLVPSETPLIQRIDFSLAFDPIAVTSSAQPSTGYYASYFPPSSSTVPSSSLEPSVFDRSLTPIIEDVAPFVRGIIAYEGRLQKMRQKRSSFLTEAASASSANAPSSLSAQSARSAPGVTSESETSSDAATVFRRRPAKRMRTTRAALSAMDGGPRSAVRKERWFDNADINPALVMKTAGEQWARVVEEVLVKLGEEAAAADARDAATAAVRAARAAEEAAAQPAVPMPSSVVGGTVSSAPFPPVEESVPALGGQPSDATIPLLLPASESDKATPNQPEADA